jgi:hypothetical protein
MQAQMPAGGMSALERLRGRLPDELHGRLRSAREYGRAGREAAALSSTAEPLRTAVPALDELLAGGLPRGQVVEMIGARSSGRFSAVLAALAAATFCGEAAALVDLGDGLDPQAAAALGVDLQRLLWLRPQGLKQALASAEIALGAGFPLVVLDLGNPPLRGGRDTRGEAGWLRLARAAQAHGAALLIASPYRVSGTAAATVLQAARGRARWLGSRTGAPWLLDGISCRLTLDKSRGSLASQGRSSGLELAVAPLPEPEAAKPIPAIPTVGIPAVPAERAGASFVTAAAPGIRTTGFLTPPSNFTDRDDEENGNNEAGLGEPRRRLARAAGAGRG